jgi:two-component system, chemotaxis family, CheB/CheR fusion protein
LAITLLEFLGDRASSVRIQIFGSDVSEIGINKARNGLYPENIHGDVSAERLRRFFLKGGAIALIRTFVTCASLPSTTCWPIRPSHKWT